MTGRVRRLEDNAVSVCCARGIQIMHPPTEPRATMTDVIAFARWVDLNVENPVGKDKEPDVVPAEDGRYWSTLPDSVYLEMLAWNEARHYNGQTRFFLETKDLLERLGHRVLIDYAGNAQGLRVHDCPKMAAEFLLGAPDVAAEDLRAIRSRVFEVNASEEDKAAYYRAQYKEAWGLARVDAAFVEAYGTQVGSEKLALLVRLADPGAAPQRVDDGWYTKAVVFRAICVAQLLRALGLKHPLDGGAVVTSLEPIKQLSFVQHWTRNAKLFVGKPTANEKCGEKGLQDVVRPVLKAYGMGLVMDYRKPRGSDGKQIRQRRYRLNPADCQELGELLQLKGVAGGGDWPELGGWLAAHPVTRWAHLTDV